MFKVGDRVVWNGHAATITEQLVPTNLYDIERDGVMGYFTVDISELTLLA